LAQFVELYSVAEVEVGAGGIESLLDFQGFSAAELRGELGLDQELVGAAAKNRELVRDVDFHYGFGPLAAFV